MFGLLLSPADQGEKDDKLICVCVDDPEYDHYKALEDLPPQRLKEIKRFFDGKLGTSTTFAMVVLLHLR
jgi:inorganic pyrophosphatase